MTKLHMPPGVLDKFRQARNGYERRQYQPLQSEYERRYGPAVLEELPAPPPPEPERERERD